MGGAERGRILYDAAEAIAADAENIAALETLEVGKLYRDGLYGDLPATLATFRYYAGAADKLLGSTVQLPDYAGRHRLNYTLREPLGVVGAITPWNNPIVVAGWKIAPALAAGNTIVVKPPEDAALSLLRLAEILTEVGVPPGVFNVVPGIGEVAGAALAQHPGLAKLSFTGSPEVGATMSNHAGGQFRKVTLELGGKNPQIVFPDADLDGAMPFIAVGNFLHQGQVCAAGTRVYAHESLVDEVIDRLADHAKNITLGDPFDETVGMGPVINEAALTKIMGYVESGSVRGRLARDRWTPCRPRRLVRRAHRLRGQAGAADRARGDLRPGRDGDPVQHDRGGVRARERHPLRAERDRLHREPQPRAARGARAQGRQRVDQRVRHPGHDHSLGRTRRQRPRSRARAAGIESYTEEKTVQMMF